MSLYDTVFIRCPSCGTRASVQSKSGPCILAEYDLYAAPQEVLADSRVLDIQTCDKCGLSFQIRLSPLVVPVFARRVASE